MFISLPQSFSVKFHCCIFPEENKSHQQHQKDEEEFFSCRMILFPEFFLQKDLALQYFLQHMNFKTLMRNFHRLDSELFRKKEIIYDIIR